MVCKYGRALCLLVIPTSATGTMRAIIYGILVLEVQNIAWSNINGNFDRTMRTITCDKKALTNFAKKLDFNFDTNSINNSSQATFEFKGDIINKLAVALRDLKSIGLLIYRSKLLFGFIIFINNNILFFVESMYVIHTLVTGAKTIKEFISKCIQTFTDNDIYRFMKINILTPIENMLAWFGLMVTNISKQIGNIFHICLLAISIIIVFDRRQLNSEDGGIC